MSPTDRPRAKVPPPICSDVPGTWAYDTMSGRIRTTILAKIPRENELSLDALDGLAELDFELRDPGSTALQFIADDGGPDIKTWNEKVLPGFVDRGDTWLSAPWAVTEFYFYRRVIAAVKWFDTREDPFQLQKDLGLSSALESMKEVARRLNGMCAKQEWSRSDMEVTISTALWGNRMDLSIWPVGGVGSEGESNAKRSESAVEEGLLSADAASKILANDLASVVDHVERNKQMKRVDIIVDNAGFELFCDLCLADYLISSGAAKQVVLQLKAHPTFVSDAMKKDIIQTVKFLMEVKGCKEMNKLGERWQSHIRNGHWCLVEDFFWVQPNAFWEMPASLRSELQQNSSLVLIKGDANYRRLLGDRMWAFTTAFEDVACYFPAPVCALRTFKSELACGLNDKDIARASSEDHQWLVSGKFGVIQFLCP